MNWQKKNLKLIGPIFFFLLVLLWGSTIPAEDFRTAAMGKVDLVLNHPENQLNLYRTTGNSAYMIQTEAGGWLKLFGMRKDGTGDLTRFYDPTQEKESVFHAEGYKELSNNQAFWGEVDYRFLHFGNVSFALEPEPYRNDPIFIADTTVGNFNYDGPQVRVRYQYLPTGRFSAGAELYYEISQGLKKNYTRARILRRDFSARISSAFDLGRNFVLGGFYEHANLQDEIELKKSQIDGQDPLVRRYRSEKVFWYRIGSFEHYDTYYNNWINLAIQKLNSGEGSAHLLQFNYKSLRLDSFDKTSNKYPDSDWYGDVFSAGYEWRMLNPANRLNYGARLNLKYMTSFSRHPNLEVLITEREIKNAHLEAGFLYRLNTSTDIALQGGWNRIIDRYDDYQSQIYRDVNNDLMDIKLGLDYRFDPIHEILAGVILGNSYRDDFSPRYLPDYTQYQITLGISENRLRYNYILNFEYSVKKAADFDMDYNLWRLAFYIQIFPQSSD